MDYTLQVTFQSHQLLFDLKESLLCFGVKIAFYGTFQGFTAGGFIYIAVAGVLAEMNSSGKTTLKSTAAQLTSLILGMSVALCISLVE